MRRRPEGGAANFCLDKPSRISQLLAGLHGEFVFEDGLHGVFGDRDRFVHVEIAFENVRRIDDVKSCDG